MNTKISDAVNVGFGAEEINPVSRIVELVDTIKEHTRFNMLSLPASSIHAFVTEIGRCVSLIDAHLAADAVPVGYRWRHSAGEKWQYSDTPCGWEHEPLYTHPQPAALNEVAGVVVARTWVEGDPRRVSLTDYGRKLDGGTKLYAHPQSAELNEVSGNSGELGGDERARFEAAYRDMDLTRDGLGYSASDTNYTWNVWNSALAATGKQQGGEVQGVNLSHIATCKLGELAAQGYVTNGVAIFNPETGQRGLVDNLGYVGWQGAQGIDLGQFSEPVHYWLHAIAGYVNASGVFGPVTRAAYASKVAEAKRLLALIDSQRDAGAGVGNIQPPRDLRTKLGDV